MLRVAETLENLRFDSFPSHQEAFEHDAVHRHFYKGEQVLNREGSPSNRIPLRIAKPEEITGDARAKFV